MFWLVALAVLLASFVCTPLAIVAAKRMGAVDVPGEFRRLHRESTPRNGGLAVMLPVFFGVALLDGQNAFSIALLSGGALMLAVGLVDDIVGLGALTKLFFQIAAAFATVLRAEIGENWTQVALSVLWVVLLTNAHNFIDGMDGLLSGVAIGEGALLSLLLWWRGQESGAMCAFLTASALLGFSYYNRHPASIFLGDCGSESIGFLFGVLSLSLFSSSLADLQNLSPLFLFAYPLTDLVTSVVRRLLRGSNPFRGDRGHLHHRIYATGIPTKSTVGMLVSVSFSLGALGVCVGVEKLWMLAIGMCLCSIGILAFWRRYLLENALPQEVFQLMRRG